MEFMGNEMLRKVALVFKLWNMVMNNVRMRDRSVKLIQYSCQMLLGFYSNAFHENVKQSLKVTRSIASTSRKAFWLLKSINHVHSVVGMIPSTLAEVSIQNSLAISEQLCLIVYYWMENLVFLSRAKLISTSEEELDGLVNWSWFLGDCACFLVALISLLEKFAEDREFRTRQCVKTLIAHYGSIIETIIVSNDNELLLIRAYGLCWC
jgi:hypothetical protein